MYEGKFVIYSVKFDLVILKVIVVMIVFISVWWVKIFLLGIIMYKMVKVSMVVLFGIRLSKKVLRFGVYFLVNVVNLVK